MKKTSPILILLTAVAACAVISGCRMGMDDSCTVWTDTITYSAFYSSLGISLSDGYYGRLELSDYERSIVLSAMPGHAKHDWTKGKIKDYLTGRGFGSAEAEKESAWLTTVDHGFIASRTQSLVYIIVK